MQSDRTSNDGEQFMLMKFCARNLMCLLSMVSKVSAHEFLMQS